MKVKGFSGLNTVADSSRLGPDKYGIIPLTEAVNVEVDQYNRIIRRRGCVQKRAEDSHSLWSDGGPCYFVSGGALFELLPDFSRRGIRSGIGDNPVSFAQAGDKVFYCNGEYKGYVQDGQSKPWAVSAFVGPETDRTFDDPPIGHLCAYFAGMMWVAREDEIFRSEPFALGWFDLFGRRLREKGKIRLLAPVANGIYIGDEFSIYFYGLERERTKVADYPAIEGAVTFCDASAVSDKMSGRSAIITTTNGICLAAPGGAFINLTEDTLTYPPALSGSSVLNKNRLITLLHD